MFVVSSHNAFFSVVLKFYECVSTFLCKVEKFCYFTLRRSPKGLDKDFVQWFVEDYCKDINTSQELSIVYVCGDFWKRILPKHCVNLLLSQDGDVCALFLEKTNK